MVSPVLLLPWAGHLAVERGNAPATFYSPAWASVVRMVRTVVGQSSGCLVTPSFDLAGAFRSPSLSLRVCQDAPQDFA
jgi:hypothetical protein